jgi:hypothetical protein
MASQNNPGRQFDKCHALTIVAAAALAASRFIAYDGGYATSAGGVKDSQGVSETAADAAGDALSLVTGYSYRVEAGEAIAFGDYVKPDAGGTGKAIVGAANECCGRALGAASAAGELIEVQIFQRHQHAV